MTHFPDHEALRELLPSAALGVLDDAELRAVLLHVQECAECEGLLEEYREVVVALGALTSPRRLAPERSAAVRARLMARVRADAAGSATPDAAPARAPAARWGGWMVAAAFGGALLVHHSVHRPIDYGWLAAGVLLLGLAALGVYARRQRAAAAALREELASFREKGPPRG